MFDYIIIGAGSAGCLLANRLSARPKNRVCLIEAGPWGASSVNAMIYTRGHPCDYDHWAALGNAGWDYQSVLPWFRHSERQQHARADRHDCRDRRPSHFGR